MNIIVHRANDSIHKENTLEAVLNTIELDYIDGIELDVRKTNDNIFVLNHNAVVDNKIIYKTNKDELNLDKLSTVLKKIKTNKIILLDLKLENLDIRSYVKYLIKLLNKYKKLNIWLCSFNYNLIKYLKEKTNYKCGLLISTVVNVNKKTDIFDFISVNYHIYKKTDKLTMVWTINKEEQMKRFKSKNVYIITDKPSLAKNIIDNS